MSSLPSGEIGGTIVLVTVALLATIYFGATGWPWWWIVPLAIGSGLIDAYGPRRLLQRERWPLRTPMICLGSAFVLFTVCYGLGWAGKQFLT